MNWSNYGTRRAPVNDRFCRRGARAFFGRRGESATRHFAAARHAALRMFSLASLLAAHRSLLALDSASARVQAGWLRDGAAPVWAEAETEAGAGLFDCAGRALAAGGAAWGEIGAFVFCEGPGSILGIRTAAMALRAWAAVADAPRPVYAYRGLELVARELARHATAPFAVIADARRDAWHCVQVSAEGQIHPLRRVPAAELAAIPGGLFMPAGFRAWAAPPRPAQTCAYDLAALFAGQPGAEIFRAAPAPDAFLPEDPLYQTWTPRIHRAPGAAAVS